MASVCVCSQLVLPTGTGLVVEEPFPVIAGVLLLTCLPCSESQPPVRLWGCPETASSYQTGTLVEGTEAPLMPVPCR